MNDFYDKMAPFYHLIFPNWDSSIKRQASQLDSIIKEFWGDQVRTILDVSCGIGTQALGLAQLNYQVTGSDLSDEAIERAKNEARKRGLAISFSVTDMREAFAQHQRQFDLIISCDNSIPHLLTDQDILIALQQFYACVHPGGGCLITVRDYDKVERSGTHVNPYGIRVENNTRYLIFQVWEFEGDIYDLAMYFIADRGGSECAANVMRTKYYAVSTNRLMNLMETAGFVEVKRLAADRFYQPVILGKKGENDASA